MSWWMDVAVLLAGIAMLCGVFVWGARQVLDDEGIDRVPGDW